MVFDEKPPFMIEALASRHIRKDFSCGDIALDRYLQRQAGQDARKHVAATFVLVEKGGLEILGYYSLSATSVRLADLPERIAKKLPRYPLVPAILLGRLAVDETKRNKGYGQVLLIDALKRCLAANEIGWAALIVDAKDENAASFYEHHEFIRLSKRPLLLYLARTTISSLF